MQNLPERSTFIDIHDVSAGAAGVFAPNLAGERVLVCLEQFTPHLGQLSLGVDFVIRGLTGLGNEGRVLGNAELPVGGQLAFGIG